MQDEPDETKVLAQQQLCYKRILGRIRCRVSNLKHVGIWEQWSRPCRTWQRERDLGC